MRHTSLQHLLRASFWFLPATIALAASLRLAEVAHQAPPPVPRAEAPAEPWLGMIESVVKVDAPRSWGTAFVIKTELVGPGHYAAVLLTAEHVVEDWAVGEVWALRDWDDFPLGEIRGVVAHPDFDVAIVAADMRMSRATPPLQFAQSPVGERAHLVSYPVGQRLVLTDGRVAQWWGPKRCLSASGYLGCSGGPVLNDAGEVIGILQGVGTDATLDRQHPLAITFDTLMVPLSLLDEWEPLRNL